ncbi:uncharacterized protein LOC131957471 [Physella acuta]|uniref:uncharacterized protein LOC131957471 n=1 Tax=Physella acuta TaxID=109671 RepID=UPI0027DD526A|nr:uncharacterized protein LOC131957471 [Physella acuta]
MANTDNLLYHLRNKRDAIDKEHSFFQKALGDFVSRVTTDVNVAIKLGEVTYGKYKELSSSMEHVLNLLIQLSAEIQKPIDNETAVNTDDIVETVYSRLSSELAKKDKEMKLMLSNQRKEFEEKFQRNSDEWSQKNKELSTHFDNLEVKAEGSFQKLFNITTKCLEQQNNDKVQLKRENESLTKKITDISDGLQSLQEKWNIHNFSFTEKEKKVNDEFTKKSREIALQLSELKTQNEKDIKRLMKEQIEKLNDHAVKVGRLEHKSNDTDVRVSKLSEKCEFDAKNLKMISDKVETLEDKVNKMSVKSDMHVPRFNAEGPILAPDRGVFKLRGHDGTNVVKETAETLKPTQGFKEMEPNASVGSHQLNKTILKTVDPTNGVMQQSPQLKSQRTPSPYRYSSPLNETNQLFTNVNVPPPTLIHSTPPPTRSSRVNPTRDTDRPNFQYPPPGYTPPPQYVPTPAPITGVVYSTQTLRDKYPKLYPKPQQSNKPKGRVALFGSAYVSNV